MRDDEFAIRIKWRVYLILGGKALLNALEKKYNAKSKIVFDAVRELMTPPEEPKRYTGFHS